MEKLIFTDQDGEATEFYVEEQTRMNGYQYLLVSETQGEEADAYILKDISSDGDQDSEYVMVEDEVELESLSRIFAEMLEDVEIEIN